MNTVGVPEQAIKQEMTKNGITEKEIDEYFKSQ